MADTDFVGGFAKGLSVIEAFGEQTPRLTITEASQISGLDRSTARRCLLTLASLGYADYDGKFFSLTPKILSLGHAYLSATPLPALVQPFLDQFSAQIGQSMSVSVLVGNDIVYVARAALKKVMSINLMPGSSMPAYCTSMGRVLLAAQPTHIAREIISSSELKARTPHTLTKIDAIIEEIQRVQLQGFAVIDQELELGLVSIAVPVLNGRNETVAALNIGLPASQVRATALSTTFLKALQTLQHEIRSVLA